MAEIEGQVRTETLDAEADQRRRAALAHIRQYPDPALRMRAGEVEAFDDDLRALVERMKALMQDASGVGLAANQVGVLRRVFVFQPVEREEVRALVNARVVERSDEVESDEEGCLSLQGVRAPVERAARVVLEASDVDGAAVRLELSELGARVAQHELDHLDGVLILDRTSADARRRALAILRPKPVLAL